MKRMHGNEQAAIYHVFEELLTDRGLVSEPEFFLPPNEFDIVGGLADTRRGEFALIAALNAEEGAMLDFDRVEGANKRLFAFSMVVPHTHHRHQTTLKFSTTPSSVRHHPLIWCRILHSFC